VNTLKVYDGGNEPRKHANSHVSVAPPVILELVLAGHESKMRPISGSRTTSGISRFQTSTSCSIVASAPTCRYERGRTGAGCAPRSGCYFRVTGETPRRFTTTQRGDTTRHRKLWRFYTLLMASAGEFINDVYCVFHPTESLPHAAHSSVTKQLHLRTI